MTELTAAEALADAAPSFELVVSPNRIFEDGRRCCESGCTTILCRYNPGPDCYLHQDERIARQRQEAARARERAA